jgi:RimJ/RimL family protein N-acetyltransferase
MEAYLKKQRVILRPFLKTDWKDLFAYLSDPRVVKYEPYETQTKDSCKTIAQERSNNGSFWAIELINERKVIGNIYIQKLNPGKFNTWMVGYVLNSDYWGEGYASEALQKTLNYLFRERNGHRVIAKCNIANKSSWRLLERNKFRREGELINNAYASLDKNGQPNWHSSYEYAILRDDWLKNQTN